MVILELFPQNNLHHPGAHQFPRPRSQGRCAQFETPPRSPRKLLYSPSVARFVDRACAYGFADPTAFNGSKDRNSFPFHFRRSGLPSHGTFVNERFSDTAILLVCGDLLLEFLLGVTSHSRVRSHLKKVVAVGKSTNAAQWICTGTKNRISLLPAGPTL